MWLCLQIQIKQYLEFHVIATILNFVFSPLTVQLPYLELQPLSRIIRSLGNKKDFEFAVNRKLDEEWILIYCKIFKFMDCNHHHVNGKGKQKHQLNSSSYFRIKNQKQLESLKPNNSNNNYLANILHHPYWKHSWGKNSIFTQYRPYEDIVYNHVTGKRNKDRKSTEFEKQIWKVIRKLETL